MKTNLTELKNFSQTLVGKVTIFGAMVALVVANFGPIMKAFAVQPPSQENYAILALHNANEVPNGSNVDEVIIGFQNGTLRIVGSGLYSDGNSTVYTPVGNQVVLDVNSTGEYEGRIWVDGVQYGSTYSFTDSVSQHVNNIDVEFIQAGFDPQEGNTSANVQVHAGDGTYGMTRRDPETGDEVVVDVDYDDMIDLRINGTLWDHESPTISYNSAPEDETVVFTFETLWINRYYDNIVINNRSFPVADYIDFDDRVDYLNHNKASQMISFDIPNIQKSDSYDIIVKHGENNGTRYITTFLWTGDPEQAEGHDYIGNSKLEFVRAVYEVDDQEYTVTEDDIEGNTHREGEYEVFHSVDEYLSYGVKADVDYDDGSLTLPGESEVTMRVVPQYGYQVTSVNGGDDFTTTDEGVSEFTLTMHNGEAGYFQATVEPIDNVVNPISEKVKAGEIVLGENAASDIENGTVVLSVEDVELSDEKKIDFEKEAGDYTINSYLDINLAKVLYKGSADDVWSEQIHNLMDKALITLQLEKGVDGNSIIIVHNIGDGDEFEIIPIESYDPITNTITFYTDSFSNYAIASRTVESPETGAFTNDGSLSEADRVLVAIMTAVIVAGIVIILATKYLNRRSNK